MLECIPNVRVSFFFVNFVNAALKQGNENNRFWKFSINISSLLVGPNGQKLKFDSLIREDG